MSSLRPELLSLVDALASANAQAGAISLDALGEAIGSRAVSYDEIDAMLSALEARGIHVDAHTDERLTERLRVVVRVARALATELKRRPVIGEIAARAALSESEVRGALMLARVMQR